MSGATVGMAGEGAVLVTGSTGTTGSRLATQLTARGVAVIAANRAGKGPAGTKPTRFDWHDPTTHLDALAGTQRMYLIPPIGDPDPSVVMLPFLERARRAGVRRVVLLSNAPTPAGGPGPGIVHQAIAAMFHEWAVLRPTWFMQNVTGEHPHARMIRHTSTIVTATGSQRVGFIDAGDIARVGVEALLTPEALNADLILTGPQALSYEEMATILGKASGRAITHVAVAPEEVPALYGSDRGFFSVSPVPGFHGLRHRFGQRRLDDRYCRASDRRTSTHARRVCRRRVPGVTRRSMEPGELAGSTRSGTPRARERSDVVRNRALILEAAGTLFDEATDAMAVTMDDVAAAAGVGKGTVFRRFGDQAGLLRAVFDARIAALVEKIESGPAPLGPSTPPRERIPAALAATVEFKVENRQLTRLLERVEQRPAGVNFFETPNYRWAHALLSKGLAEIGDPANAQFSAHALLSLTRIDFIEHFLFAEGHTTAELQRHIIDHVDRIIGPPTSAANPVSGARRARSED